MRTGVAKKPVLLYNLISETFFEILVYSLLHNFGSKPIKQCLLRYESYFRQNINGFIRML